MKRIHGLCWGIIILLLAGNVFCAMRVIQMNTELHAAQEAIQVNRTNEKVVAFAQLFVDKVLTAEQDVDFETRLRLENAVRALGDDEIMTAWKQFVESETEAQAQKQVKTLLELLVKKIQV